MKNHLSKVEISSLPEFISALVIDDKDGNVEMAIVGNKFSLKGSGAIIVKNGSKVRIKE